jgi:hypothetical protein
MEQFGQQHRSRYRQRLRDRHGWDQAHAQALGQLQSEQIEHRNQSGGYWIAEATPEAADHAIVITKPVGAAPYTTALWAAIAKALPWSHSVSQTRSRRVISSCGAPPHLI